MRQEGEERKEGEGRRVRPSSRKGGGGEGECRLQSDRQASLLLLPLLERRRKEGGRGEKYYVCAFLMRRKGEREKAKG